MNNRSLKVIYYILFAVFVAGYIYTFATLMGLYLINPILGAIGTILFPFLMIFILYFAFKWIGGSHSRESVAPYVSTDAYARVWSLAYEWVALLVTIFTVAGLFPQPWMTSLLWILLAAYSHFLYPKYLFSVFNQSIASSDYQHMLKAWFRYVAFGVSGVAGVLGFGSLLVSGIGSLL